jgi:hypothetical protein
MHPNTSEESVINLISPTTYLPLILGSIYVVILIICLIFLYLLHTRSKHKELRSAFFLFAALNCSTRSVDLYMDPFHVLNYEREPLAQVVMNLPLTFYYAAYMVVILYWLRLANEIRNHPMDNQFAKRLRIIFFVCASVLIVAQMSFFIFLFTSPLEGNSVLTYQGYFHGSLSVVAAFGIFVAGVNLVMASLSGTHSAGMGQTLVQKARVHFLIICIIAICFIARAIVDILRLMQRASPSTTEGWLQLLAFFISVELFPLCLMIWVMRYIPPRKSIAYQPLVTEDPAEPPAKPSLTLPAPASLIVGSFKSYSIESPLNDVARDFSVNG